jgi:hypothetical protein
MSNVLFPRNFLSADIFPFFIPLHVEESLHVPLGMRLQRTIRILT